MTDAITKFAASLAEETEKNFRNYLFHRNVENENQSLALLAVALVCCDQSTPVFVNDLFDTKHNLPSVLSEENVARFSADTIMVFPQVNIGAYNAGLLVLASCRHSDRWHRLVVECDEGADTDVIPIKSRSSDRFLQEEGYAVFRFTAEEVHSDLYRCAKQVLEWCHAKIRSDHDHKPKLNRH